jgi:CRISPR/Cas system Type II protein with McrA/HNH and RuvC-like nuclease domain
MKDIEEQNIKFRICYVCRKKLELNANNFYKNKTKSEGFELCCKSCSKHRLAEYHKNQNPKTELEKKEYNKYRNEWRNRQKEKNKCRVCKNDKLKNSAFCEKHYFAELAQRHLGTSTRWIELKELWDKQKGKCAYSGRQLTLGLDTNVDHIKPLSKHPELLNDISNLQYIHKQLNFFKQDLEEYDFLKFVQDVKNNMNL